ncbi:MAG: ABC transporter permease [Spirochaetia bacterium]|jgi:ribose transport system permease protein
MSMKTEGARLTAFSYFVRKEYRLLAAFLILILLIVILLIEYPGKLSLYFFTAWANQGAGLAFASVGQTMVVLTSGIDMSIGGIFALANCLCSVFLNGNGWQIAGGFLLVLSVGLCCGLLNGLIVAYVRIQPIIATIATSAVFYGIALFIRPIPGGSVSETLSEALTYDIFGVPTSLILLLVIVIVFWTIIKKTKLGTGIYAVGSSERSAFMSGVKVDQVKIAAYALSGLFASLGGMFLSLQTQSGDASIGMTYTMNSVAAAVIGGTTLAGGIGGAYGSVIGTYLLRTLRSIMFFAGIAPMAQPLFEGIILIIAISVGSIRLFNIKNRIEVFR